MIVAEVDQRKLPSGARLSRRVVSAVMAAIDRRVKPRLNGELSVAFVSESEMRRINRERRKKDKVTDVLSFSYSSSSSPSQAVRGSEEPSGSRRGEGRGEVGEIGEVLICYPQAKRQAAERGHTVRQEVLDLLIHGTLHVLGFDHETPRDAKEMLPLQQRIFDAL